jgi:hypothetical protein
MAPRLDDPDIADGAFVLRALHDKWVVMKEGQERPRSDSFTDSTYENSFFIEGEISADELRQLTGFTRIVRVPVRLLRAVGYLVERRPDEAPDGCTRPESHVVAGPPETMTRKQYERASRSIATSPEIELV